MAARHAYKFKLNEPLEWIEEDCWTEFKEPTGQNPARRITDDVEDYLVGFLNGNGGRIFWGIRDRDRVVIGVPLDSSARDEVRKGVANRVHGIDPKVDPSRYELEFHPVLNAKADSDLCVVEVSVTHVAGSDPFYNHRGDAYIRLNGVNQKLNGAKLTGWIKTRLHASPPVGSADDPNVLELVRRVRQVLSAHGLEPGHMARFLELRKAPFSITLADLKNDTAFLHWLDETKIDWIAHTFLVRREWIDGEDERIHEEFQFDKQPERFFSTVSQHVDPLIWDEVHDNPIAYFLRRGIGKDWDRKGGQDVFFVLAVPLARFSNERTIFKYLTDQAAYPWRYGRTNIQLRAWARLLDINKRIYCSTDEISLEVASKVEGNAIFLRDMIENHRVRCRDDWHIEDYGLYRSESAQAKGTEQLPDVIEFLKKHNLPWEETRLGPPS